MNKNNPTVFSIAWAVVALLMALPAAAQWSADPGATVRNIFGPQAGNSAPECRGACGGGCPDTCTKAVAYECLGSSKLRRVVTYTCGTHQGCREHDDCLDNCQQNGSQGGDCQTECDASVMEDYGFQNATSWLTGRGPYDGETKFQYTLDAPGALEPAYTCPDGASPQCSASSTCVTAAGVRVDPVFDAYPAAGTNAMRVSAFRSGPACGDSVCEHSSGVQMTGTDTCPGGNCTRFGMEFDYENADPSAPLECTPSTSGGDSDFVGGLLKLGADAMTSRGGTEPAADDGEDGMASLLNVFAQVLSSADSPEDVNVSMAPLGPDGKPIESQRVGTVPSDGSLPPIPRTVDLPAQSGHLFVPMYQMADARNSSAGKERMIRCTHKGTPVLETSFRFY